MKITGKLWLSSVSLSLLILGLYLRPILSQSAPSYGDYAAHTGFALEIKSGQLPENLPHFFFQFEVIAATYLFPNVSPHLLSALVVVWHIVLTALILNFLFYAALKQRPGGTILAGIISISLLLVAPITLLTFHTGNLYFGYFVATIYHNPTINIIKTWSIPLFLLALMIFRQTNPARDRLTVIAIMITVLVASLTKPNYLIALLPSIGLIAVYYLYKKRPVRWTLLVIFFVTAIVVLTVQSTLLTTTSKIVSPLQSFLAISGDINHTTPSMMPIKLVLSILFPLVVAALYFPAVQKDLQLVLAWITTIIALFAAYILIEVERAAHGNWYWGAATAVFVLFVMSALFLVKQPPPVLLRVPRALPFRFWIATGAFALHLFFGIIWYIACNTTRYYW